eukprot:TRINITY_DN41678_c0_g1_i1.p1 TRINITY_DN41678_c0_g1~~TRINITY_DN41678_c0_g1_i1.p1  ORF type:complete len:453 (+),score=79.83 TRINITY_DN41678_c0_g1_i1:106-1464(+)
MWSRISKGLFGGNDALDHPDVSPELWAEVDKLPSPIYDDHLYIASCRAIGHANRFCDPVLLFQPDCRRFCSKGLHCELYLEEQGEKSAAHRAHFLHVGKDVYRLAVDRDLESRSPATLVVNAPKVKAELPFIPYCWSVQAEHLAAGEVPLPRSIAPGRSVVIYVHGFRQHYNKVCSLAQIVQSQLRKHGVARKDGRHTPVVIGFLWPCGKRRRKYVVARKNAEDAAPRLRCLLTCLAHLGCPTTVVAHSLGARVALTALKAEPASIQPDSPMVAMGSGRLLVGNLFLLGAAVAKDALSQGGEFDRYLLRTEQVTVFHSPHDDVLGNVFGLGEALHDLWEMNLGGSGGGGSLGADGVAEPVPSRCTCIDVASSVDKHNATAWLCSSQVMEPIAAAVSASQTTEVDSDASPSTREDKESGDSQPPQHLESFLADLAEELSDSDNSVGEEELEEL